MKFQFKWWLCYPSMWYTVSVSNINNYCIWVACVVIMWWCGTEILSGLGWSHYSPIQTFLLVKILISVQVIPNECEQNIYTTSLSSYIPPLALIEEAYYRFSVCWVLKSTCGTLPGRGDFIVKSPMEQTVEEKKKDNFFKNLWIVFLYNVIAWWFSVSSQDFLAMQAYVVWAPWNWTFALFSSTFRSRDTGL